MSIKSRQPVPLRPRVSEDHPYFFSLAAAKWRLILVCRRKQADMQRVRASGVRHRR